MTLTAMLKYDTYKNSGVDWLGEIPFNWNIKPGLVAFSENKRSNKGMKEEVVLSLSYGKIIVKPVKKLVGLVPQSFETYQIVEPHDIIVRCTDLQNDQTSLRIGLAKDHGIITSAYLNLKVSDAYSARYLYYYLYALDTTKVIYRFGSGLRQNLSFIDFKRLPVFDIPRDTQTAIADFIDEKTAKIDEAIAIKEKQISLLNERKQILNQQAVTQGLDPTVPMKDSGIEWIGKIPEHWSCLKLKLVCNFILDGTHGSYPRVDVGYRLLGVRNIVNDEFIFRDDDSKVSYRNFKEISTKFKVSEGDIQLAIVGATLGKVAVVKKLEEDVVTQRSLATLRVKHKLINSAFLASFLRSQSYSRYLWSNTSFSAQPGVYLNTIQNSYIALPPKDEQNLIDEHIKNEAISLNRAIDTAQLEIDRLNEYKIALIYSAVTGKIKVV
ncbi:restriction endonuclease subunit S [Aeromonas hydrophila]|uniref:restriction endonuclease subunit S n=1 Tax=Aeromonas hydrophila TaxID=644 RepID=UPI003F7B0B27